MKLQQKINNITTTYPCHWDSNEHILFDISMMTPSFVQVETCCANRRHSHAFLQ